MASNSEYEQQRTWNEKPMIYISGVDSRHTYKITGNSEVEFVPVKDKKGWFTIKTSNQIKNK